MNTDSDLIKQLEREIGKEIEVRSDAGQKLKHPHGEARPKGPVRSSGELLHWLMRADVVTVRRNLAITNSEGHVVRLYLAGIKELQDFPSTVFELTSIELLLLDGESEISFIPAAIRSLDRLRMLYLGHLPNLQELPPELARLPRLDETWFPQLRLSSPPYEIAEQGIDAIRNYFASLEETESVDYLYEAKMVLVGRGFAGKTSLAQRLTRPGYELEEKIKSTEGIAINPWNLEMPLENSDRFRFNIWDFGGQEKYDATHQFFITERTVYLFVTEARQEANFLDFDYWLNIVQMLGKNSPVIVVQNKIDERNKSLPTAKYSNQFPNIVGFVDVSCKHGYEGTIDELRERIQEAVRKLPQVGDKLPGEWVKVREDLAALTVNHITYAKYCSICKKHGLDKEKADFLSRYFHDLGVIVHHQNDPLLEKMVIVNPDWAVDAVYNVLDTKSVEEGHGRFADGDLEKIWKHPKYKAKRPELLALMKNYQICFELPAKGNYIAPELLAANPAEYEPIAKAGRLTFMYRYAFMPAGLISRLIVKLHHCLEGEAYWRHGLVAKFGEARGLVVEDDQTRQIRIDIEGEDAGAKRELLGAIRSRFAEIYEDFNRKIEYEERIPCNCQECRAAIEVEKEPHYFDWATVQRYARKPLDKIRCENSLEEVSVATLMGQVGGGPDVGYPESPDVDFVPETTEKPRVFLSYCHDDKEEVVRLAAGLTAKGVEVWWDKDILPGQDWIEEIRKARKQSDAVVVCLSANCVGRKQTGVVPEILDAIKEYRKRWPGDIYLIPVRLSECEIPDIRIDEVRKLDSLQHVDLFPESAWETSVERLVQAIRQA